MTNEPKAGTGLDPEMLAAYIDKRLSPDARAVVEAQLAADPDSYAVLVATLRAQGELGEDAVIVSASAAEGRSGETSPKLADETRASEGRPKVPRVRRWAVAGGVLAAAAALVLVVRLQPDLLQRIRGGDVVDPRFAKLVEAVGEERYIEARLTGGFKYGPIRPVTRGLGDLPDRNLALLAAAGELQKKVRTDPRVEDIHAWGVAQLQLGFYDAAVATLEEAGRARPDDARLLTDLSAAYLTRAQLTDRAEDWPRALSLAIRAIERTPAPLPEAFFNRALAAEALHLSTEAAGYWKAFLDVEARVEWRREAEQHLSKLGPPTEKGWLSTWPEVLEAIVQGRDDLLDAFVRHYPQQAREWVEDRLLSDWAQQHQRRDLTAGTTLEHARRMASALVRQNADDLLLQSIVLIQGLDDRSRLAAANGYEAYRKGRDLYEAAAMQDSAAPFATARTAFRDLKLPLAEWAELYVAIASYYQGNYDDTLRRLDGVTLRIADQPWRALAARVNWVQGLVATLRADYEHSLRYYQRTLTLFQQLGESDNQGAAHSLLGGVLLYIGDTNGVWTHTIEALKRITPETPMRRQHTQLVSAANKSTRLGLPEAALAFANEASAVSMKWNDPIARVEISNYRARTLSTLGRLDEAVQEVSSARRALGTIRDVALRARVEAEVMQTEADVLVAVDPKAGVVAATRAIDFFKSTDSSLRVPRLYGVRAEGRRQLGDIEGANADLNAGALRFEDEHRKLPRSEYLRLSHSDEIWTLYKRLLKGEVDRGAPCEQVLSTAERARAVTLRGSNWDQWPTGFLPSRLTAQPSGALLHYSFVDDQLILITVFHGRCELRSIALTEDAAQTLVSRFLEDIHDRDRTGMPWKSAAGQALFDYLLRPAWGQIGTAARLDLVLDGPLHQLPFMALLVPDQRYLIEVMPIGVLVSLTPSKLSRPTDLHAAVVSAGSADPTFGLPPLSGAKDEVDAVAAAMRAAGLEVDNARTGARLLTGLQQADVVHFAGHALVNPEYPLLSRLIVGTHESDGWVTAQRIAESRSASRLVFLSACSTLAGRQYGGEGPASLARSFLASGTREVVASLWPIDDGAPKNFVEKFYEHWLRTKDAAAALRAAAVAAIDADGRAASPGRWAAWVVLGRAS